MNPAQPPRVPDKILSEATEWLVRLQSEQLDPEQRLEFERWLDQDKRHPGAYGEVRKFWNELDCLPQDTIVEIRELSTLYSAGITSNRGKRRTILGLCLLLAVAFAIAYGPSIGNRMLGEKPEIHEKESIKALTPPVASDSRNSVPFRLQTLSH